MSRNKEKGGIGRTQQEFIDYLPEGTRIPNDKEYNDIEFLYNWHPSISRSDDTGKDQIARLYSEFGMGIIRDMYSTASEHNNLCNQIEVAKVAVTFIEGKIKDAKSDVEKAEIRLQNFLAVNKISSNKEKGGV